MKIKNIFCIIFSILKMFNVQKYVAYVKGGRNFFCNNFFSHFYFKNKLLFEISFPKMFLIQMFLPIWF